ncbi:MAG: threonine synthase, partial [Planctomycetota bacterium JB042]
MLVSLACASCDAPHDPAALATVCAACGRSLSAAYDPTRLAEAFRSGSIAGRERSMWRYREVLPVGDAPPVTLGEGLTPLLPLDRLGRILGLPRLMAKEEGTNPTGSFKARGFAAAVTAARDRGATRLVAPSAGNAAGALAAYAARAGLDAAVWLPADSPAPNRLETRACGAAVTEVDGTIADAARRMKAEAGEGFDVSTLKEPYRLDGKKTMGYELFEQLGGLPDAILYPTGGGTGLLGMAKAFDELESVGLIGAARPRMIAVQARAVAPIVAAFEAGQDESEATPDGRTIATGLQVPKAFADWWVLREIRRSDGRAVAVDDDAMLDAIRRTAAAEGLLLCPEGAALVAALPRLADEGVLTADA